MRVLFVSSPGVGHVFPMVSLAWALRAAGHDVLVATAGDALAVRDAGLPVADLAPGFDRDAMVARVRQTEPGLIAEMRTRKVTDLSEVGHVFVMMSKLLVDGAVELADQWRPDVVVESMLQASGLVLAGRLGIPVVDHGFGIARPTGATPKLVEQLADLFAHYGVSEPPDVGAYVDVAPASLLAEPAAGWPMRYVPYNGGAVLPPWLREPPTRRHRIAVTLGTVAPTTTGLGPIHRLVEIASEVDAEFVVALGDVDTTGLGDLPKNVHVTGWVPLNALLAKSSALVHHGGAGTTLTALAAGVPQLVLPSGADRHINATAVHDRGVGLNATDDDVDATLLHRLVEGTALRDAADEVSAEIAAMPTPATVASQVVDLVTAA